MNMYIAKLMYHKWEEEPISMTKSGYAGTFAIFFYCCNMKCVYCQNSKISHVPFLGSYPKGTLSHFLRFARKKRSGACSPIRLNNVPLHNLNSQTTSKTIYTPEELSDEIITAEKNGAGSISFITGVLYVDKIVETIKLAKEKGLKIPIVYNSSAYETVSQIKKLDGLIDIYLPDFKYFDNGLGKLYSKVPNYTDIAKLSIKEMYRQVGNKMIVRHLVLPGHTENAKQIIKYLYDTYGDNIFLSIMSQYTPMLKNKELSSFPNLQRKLTKREYEKVLNYAIDLGVKNAYFQEGDTAKESFIPDF